MEGRRCGAPTLQRLCESAVARRMVEPRSALALLEFADAAGAQLLRQHSLAVSAQLPRIQDSHASKPESQHQVFHWLPLNTACCRNSAH